MISMTGYGRAERIDESIHASVEVRAVNNRYLDINVSLPGTMSPLEPQIRDRVYAIARRGRVEVSVRVRELQEDLAVTVDEGVLSGYLKALETLRERAGITETPALEHLLSLDGILKSERVQDRDRYWEIVEPLLDEALVHYQDSRKVEGTRLQTDINDQIGRIAACVRAIEQHAPEIESQVRENLQRRFREVVGDGIEEQRMLAEVAVQLTRFSINEELVRLNAHLESFAVSAVSSEPIGKKLDFLCQEIHREINTTGSKSITLAISEQVVEAKDALENIREQLRNIE